MRSPLESKYSVQQDEDLSFHMQSRVTGFTGKGPLHGTVGKPALSPFPSAPGNQAALV